MTSLTLKSSDYDFEDAYKRYGEFKAKEKAVPKTWTFNPHKKVSAVTPTENNKEIIPVYHFNQQTVGKGFAEYCCSPTSSLICASAFDLVNKDNFLAKAYGLITAMYTSIGKGTGPTEMMNGFNKYFSTLKMEKQAFTEENIKNNIKNNKPMVINLLTNQDLGYKGAYGHYVACTGYNGKVGINDPHGFSLGRGYRYYYNYSTIKRAVDNNGSRPLYVVSKK